MKPEAQRIAIAEACGWKRHGWGEETARQAAWDEPGVESSPRHLHMLPDYLSDLNAMHAVESKFMNPRARPIIQGDYVRHLSCVTSDLRSEWAMIHATAAQRAEAFLKATGLWV